VTAARLLRVRCSTWEQVEAFYRRKLRRSGRLSMKVPFECEIGTPVTLGLELPNQIVISIDGTVASAGAAAAGRTPIEVSLFGLSAELLARLEAMVADARSASAAEDLGLDDERRLLVTREAELRRQRRLAAHEILGVPRDPSAVELRAAWSALARREHPDAVARFASPALSAVAEATMIVAARAFDRLRASVVAEGRGAAVGPTVRPPVSWAAADDPMSTGFFSEAVTPPVDDQVELEEMLPHVVTPPPNPANVAVRWGPGDLFSDLDLGPASNGAAPIAMEESLAQARSGPGDRFVRQIRARLGQGDHGGAQEIAEAALHLYGTDRRLRGLYHVAAAMAACVRDDRFAAVAALETALAHDPACLEAATALEQLRRAGTPSAPAIQRLFA
jgi:hypothetical protein